MSTIIYLHGFASSGTSPKSAALIRAFGDQHTILSPDLPVCPSEVIATIGDAVRNSPAPHIFVGTSLGGFWAKYASAVHGGTAIIVNPSIDPATTMAGRVGQDIRNYATGARIQVLPSHLPQFDDARSVSDSLVDYSKVWLFLAMDDEVIDSAATLRDWPTKDRVTVLEDGGHRFDSHWSLVVSAVEKVIREYT